MPLFNSNHSVQTEKEIEPPAEEEASSVSFRPVAPGVENYSVRDDDDDITSSDDENTESNDASSKSWFFRSRHSRTASAEPAKVEIESSAESAIAEGTPHRSRSSSPFRKSLRSFFKRENELDPEITKDHSTEEGEEKVPETPTNTRFWRSWRNTRHGYSNNGQLESASESKKDNEDNDVETLRNLNVKDDAILWHEQKRQKNMLKLATQLEDLSPLRDDDDGASNMAADEISDIYIAKYGKRQLDPYEVNSTSSSIERALTVKDRVGLVFSPALEENAEGKDEISPLTPPEDIINNPYKYVFDASKESLMPSIAYDFAWLDKSSTAFVNFDKTLKLLTDNKKSFSSLENVSNVTISEVSSQLLLYAQHDSEYREELIKEKLAIENTLKFNEESTFGMRKELNNKDALITTLKKEVEDRTKKIEKLGNDLEEVSDEAELLTNEIESNRKKMTELQEHEKHALAKSENQISNIKNDMDLKSKMLEDISRENELLKNRYEGLQTEHKNLVFDHEVLQEKHSITTTRLSDLVGSINKGEIGEREMRNNLEMTSNKLRRYENTIELLKIGNLKIQENFHRERRKVLDLRKEDKMLKMQIQLIECHRSESLQFMSHLMFYYRGIVSDETLTQFASYLKKLNATEYLTNNNLGEAAMEAQFKDCETQVVKFYNEIAKQLFLDQIVAKHVSYMRSNNFLSSQLAGLRKHINDYEQYVSRLLKEILTQKNIQEKNKQRIAQLKQKNADYKSKISEIAQ